MSFGTKALILAIISCLGLTEVLNLPTQTKIENIFLATAD